MDRWLDINGLAEVLGVGRTWVRDKVTARAIPHHRVGKHVRFTPQDVEAIAVQMAEPVATVPMASVTGIGRTHPPAGPQSPPPPPAPKERAA